MPSRPTIISTVSVTGPSGPSIVTSLGRVRREQVAQAQQLGRVVPVHPVAEPDGLLGLAGGEREHPLLAQAHELGDAVRLDVALAREAEVALDVDLDPQALAVEAVLVALVLAQHRVEALVQVLVRAAPRVVDAHRVVGGDRPVEEAPARARPRSARAAARTSAARPTPGAGRAPGRRSRGCWLTGPNIGPRGVADRGPGRARGGSPSLSATPRARRPPVSGRDVSFRAMSTPPRPPRAPRTRSAFAAAFLSLLFPGLGHAYAGAWTRALAFAALPLLSIALLGGVVLRADRTELLGFVVQPAVLHGLLRRQPLILLSTGSSRRSTPGTSPASSTTSTPRATGRARPRQAADQPALDRRPARRRPRDRPAATSRSPATTCSRSTSSTACSTRTSDPSCDDADRLARARRLPRSPQATRGAERPAQPTDTRRRRPDARRERRDRHAGPHAPAVGRQGAPERPPRRRRRSGTATRPSTPTR